MSSRPSPPAAGAPRPAPVRGVLRPLAVGSALTMALVALDMACSSKSSPVGAGGECFLAADCAPGLVCVEQSNKTRQCSDDLERVAGRGPPEGGAEGDAATDATTDAPRDAVTPVPDTGPRDTGAVDTGPG